MESGIYYFNPTAEMAVANGIFSYQPPELLQSFEKDMATIMLFFAGDNDVVLVNEHPGHNFIHQIRSIKSDLPEFMTENELILSGRHFDKLIPWGWSPVVCKKLELILPLINNTSMSSVSHWNDEFKSFYNRMTASKVLELICSENLPELADFSSLKPQQCFNTGEVQKLLYEKGRLVLKAPFSSSGRGLQMVRRNTLNNSNIAWINSILEKQKFVMAETLHDKVADLSFHFRLKSNSEPEFLGTVYFETNGNGQFKGCHLQNNPNLEICKLTDLFIAGNGVKVIQHVLKKYYLNYDGFLGIDAMIINESGQFKIHPCVEINPRFTMGLLTLQLRKYVRDDAYWQMLFDNSGNLSKYIHPGIVPLTPVNTSTKFAAILKLY